MLDGYSTDAQLASIVNTFLERRTHEGLRDRLAFLVGHFGLMRGENVRALELADISALELPNEGPTPCTAMVTLLDHGKTDKDGRVELAAAMRSKNVETCCHDALAFYLFSRCVAFALICDAADGPAPAASKSTTSSSLRTTRHSPRSPGLATGTA